MPSWNELLDEFDKLPEGFQRNQWLRQKQIDSLKTISKLRKDRNVLFYSTAFLQKPNLPAFKLQITGEDINGYMATMYRMDWDKGLTLILHTPGGGTNATETIVKYLHSKFDYIEVIIPTFAMSAGTMISLASNKIIMGRQSQLGPIDPQLPYGNMNVSALAIVDQFNRAKKEILEDKSTAHIWAPILQSLGPSILQQAQNALIYGERMVAEWLEERMFKGKTMAKSQARDTASYFNDTSDDHQHKSHGRRIDRQEARSQNLTIEDLEDDQNLQDAVLTAYHMATIIYEKSPAAKYMASSHDRMWVKNEPQQQIQLPVPLQQIVRPKQTHQPG